MRRRAFLAGLAVAIPTFLASCVESQHDDGTDTMREETGDDAGGVRSVGDGRRLENGE